MFFINKTKFQNKIAKISYDRLCLRIKFIRYAQSQKIGKSNNLKVSGNKKPDWLKQHIQYQVWLSITKEDEPPDSNSKENDNEIVKKDILKSQT